MVLVRELSFYNYVEKTCSALIPPHVSVSKFCSELNLLSLWTVIALNEEEKIETSHTDIFLSQLVAGPSSEEPVRIHSHLASNTLNKIMLL